MRWVSSPTGSGVYKYLITKINFVLTYYSEIVISVQHRQSSIALNVKLR